MAAVFSGYFRADESGRRSLRGKNVIERRIPTRIGHRREEDSMMFARARDILCVRACSRYIMHNSCYELRVRRVASERTERAVIEPHARAFKLRKKDVTDATHTHIHTYTVPSSFVRFRELRVRLKYKKKISLFLRTPPFSLLSLPKSEGETSLIRLCALKIEHYELEIDIVSPS